LLRAGDLLRGERQPPDGPGEPVAEQQRPAGGQQRRDQSDQHQPPRQAVEGVVHLRQGAGQLHRAAAGQGEGERAQPVVGHLDGVERGATTGARDRRRSRRHGHRRGGVERLAVRSEDRDEPVRGGEHGRALPAVAVPLPTQLGEAAATGPGPPLLHRAGCDRGERLQIGVHRRDEGALRRLAGGHGDGQHAEDDRGGGPQGGAGPQAHGAARRV
jgi:hypothetical protein